MVGFSFPLTKIKEKGMEERTGEKRRKEREEEERERERKKEEKKKKKETSNKEQPKVVSIVMTWPPRPSHFSRCDV